MLIFGETLPHLHFYGLHYILGSFHALYLAGVYFFFEYVVLLFFLLVGVALRVRELELLVAGLHAAFEILLDFLVVVLQKVFSLGFAEVLDDSAY